MSDYCSWAVRLWVFLKIYFPVFTFSTIKMKPEFRKEDLRWHSGTCRLLLIKFKYVFKALWGETRGNKSVRDTNINTLMFWSDLSLYGLNLISSHRQVSFCNYSQLVDQQCCGTPVCLALATQEDPVEQSRTCLHLHWAQGQGSI